jgi:H+/Cl- antiporter ClcA
MQKIERWMLLLVSFTLVGLGEELVNRFLQANVSHSRPWSRALAIMVVVGIAYTLAAEVLSPQVSKSIRKVHEAVKPGRGGLAGICGAVVLLGLVYLGYFLVYR